ncbi:DUF5999 family protein [Streptomyces zhihengii]|uniref:DUF5999 family protein n=1 Tax=Streptomyces zhihengii TaxID=1818004 RepID=UPI00362ABE23
MNLARFRISRRSASTPTRCVVSAAQETLAVVLTDGCPIPESDQDIHDLMLRLRGHLMQLGTLAPTQTEPVTSALEVAWVCEAQVPVSHAQALLPLVRFASAIRAVLGALRAEGALCEHSSPCPPASAVDRLAAKVLVGPPGVGWCVLCNGVILFEDTGYLLPSGDIGVPRRPLPREAVVT